MILVIFLLAAILLIAGGAGLVSAIGLMPTDLGFTYFQSGTIALSAGMIVLALGFAVKALERAFSRLATPAAIRVHTLSPEDAPAGMAITGAMAGAAAGTLAATTIAAADGVEPQPVLTAPEKLLEDFERDLFTGIEASPAPAPATEASPSADLRQDPPFGVPDSMPVDISLTATAAGTSGLVDARVAESAATEAEVMDDAAGSYALPGDDLSNRELSKIEPPKIELPEIELPKIEPFEFELRTHEAVKSDIVKNNIAENNITENGNAGWNETAKKPGDEPMAGLDPAPVPGLIADADLAAVSDEALPPLAPVSDLEIVGSYDSAGTRFTMYSDGSVIAAGPQGERRFRSLDELRRHLDAGLA